MDTQQMIQQLIDGFAVLQDDYAQLFAQHLNLERKLAAAREQYNELSKLCRSSDSAITTPPISLASSCKPIHTSADSYDVAEILEQRQARDAAQKLRLATVAARNLSDNRTVSKSTAIAGVKIWSGPSADNPERAGSSLMPSISESPLEQDFTVEGKPSKLGCPFASMANKKLSSHAASVLSRYNTRESIGGGISSTPLSSVDRINGKESLSRRRSWRASFTDPIKAEICGLSDHHKQQEPSDLKQQVEPQQNTEIGVCPIRFLDQHSPEEVATYFEKHKHELPRSHEVCVLRYQSNQEQIRQLDAKYGNLVSMIQGLGAKHKNYLPDDPDPVDAENETAVVDARNNEKVRKWASSVFADAGRDDHDDVLNREDHVGEGEDRKPHFARPLREIRVGESPSRPWGIPVPAKYMEGHESRPPSEPAAVAAPSPSVPTHLQEGESREVSANDKKEIAPGQCPFGRDGEPATAATMESFNLQTAIQKCNRLVSQTNVRQPAFVAIDPPAPGMAENQTVENETPNKSSQPQMIFTGPVFVGYSAEDAAKILRESGLGAEATK
ncbi:hypothetical protein M433DRAFT_92996 [Acidomyces richmondensis BFW]|nr:MAG: hypothetical protein FE78DRAFT_172466 [Acidomyces sp. 'richmondensis']KYG43682.1 hypothetical protein M433DRAFT_92996 [Acidomyces richmondensis BFW]